MIACLLSTLPLNPPHNGQLTHLGLRRTLRNAMDGDLSQRGCETFITLNEEPTMTANAQTRDGIERSAKTFPALCEFVEHLRDTENAFAHIVAGLLVSTTTKETKRVHTRISTSPATASLIAYHRICHLANNIITANRLHGILANTISFQSILTILQANKYSQ